MTERPLTMTDADVLDHATWTALRGPHARFAEGAGLATRYPTDVSAFAAFAPGADAGAWPDLEALIGPGGIAAISGELPPLPNGWTVLMQGSGVQMVDVSVRGSEAPDAVVLGLEDVPEMLDLVERTRPGPFLPRTIELGRYLGIRIDGALVAMAGERLHPPGWTEISAVCTDPAHRGRGLGAALVLAVAAGIEERGERAFLHAAAANTTAIRLYERLGFVVRRRNVFQRVQAPHLEDDHDRT